MLTLFSFEAGLSPSLTVIDDEDKDVLFQAALTLSLDVEMMNEMETLAERFSIERKNVREVIKNISDNARNNSMSIKQLERSGADSVASLRNVLPKPNQDWQKTIKALQKIIPGLRERLNAVNDGTAATMDSLSFLEAFLYKLQQGLFKIYSY